MRYQDWPSRLFAAIEDKKTAPFAWGVNDCCLFAADIVLAITGNDYAAEYRGQYDSQLTAAQALRDLGEGDLLSTIDSKFSRIPLLQARRGDLVALQTAEGPALGICAGTCYFVGPAGMFQYPLSGCVTAWRVV
jgi:hypothetical protein